MEQLPVNHVWFFLTDRCNLRCAYCFFKHKTGRRVLCKGAFDRALDWARCIGGKEFIFSGGEPLLEWGVLRRMILSVRKNSPQDYISVQSNLLLLDTKKALFLKKYRVNVEVGIDGDEKTTLLNRPGVGAGYYKKLCEGIRLLQKAKVDMTATMTVYPSGVKDLFDNFLVLKDLGLRLIEIHPAFLEKWTVRSRSFFMEGYRKASAHELRVGVRGVIGREYSRPARGGWDMVVLPDGKVLPNWTFLSFPEEVRARFYLINFLDQRSGWRAEADVYFKKLRSFCDGGVRSYRQISNFNASLGLSSHPARLKKSFEEYRNLCQEIENLDHRVEG